MEKEDTPSEGPGRRTSDFFDRPGQTAPESVRVGERNSPPHLTRTLYRRCRGARFPAAAEAAAAKGRPSCSHRRCSATRRYRRHHLAGGESTLSIHGRRWGGIVFFSLSQKKHPSVVVLFLVSSLPLVSLLALPPLPWMCRHFPDGGCRIDWVYTLRYTLRRLPSRTALSTDYCSLHRINTEQTGSLATSI